MEKISYAVGDLVNGDYATAETYDAALQIYNDDAESGAQSALDNRADTEDKEGWGLEDFFDESKEFHYIAKITLTTTLDEDGDEETDEQREIIEGGTLNLNQ